MWRRIATHGVLLCVVSGAACGEGAVGGQGVRGDERAASGVSGSLYEQEFEGRWITQWRSIRYAANTTRQPGYSGDGLRTRISAGSHFGGDMSLRLADLGKSERDSMYFRYYLKFGANWKPTVQMTGKIPGPADLNGTDRCKGGKPPTSSSPCWSARMMWRNVGTAAQTRTDIGFYTYHFDQAGKYGDKDRLVADGYTPLANNRWYCIEGYVRMNDPTLSNGVIKGWVNGRPALTRTNLRFRTAANLHLERFWYDIYYGAKPTAPSTMDVHFDRLVLASRRIGCASRATDPMWEPGADNEVFKDMPPGSFAHAEALELHRRGITTGCRGEPNRMFCPRANVTRSQMAAFLARALKLPPAKEDHFTDDEGSTFEADHNRLYEARITSGCATGAFCGDDLVTREQMAAFLRRSFALPATTEDFFTDDDHSIFEADINALAAAGITRGCGDETYCPAARLTRAQMAIFLVRALQR